MPMVPSSKPNTTNIEAMGRTLTRSLAVCLISFISWREYLRIEGGSCVRICKRLEADGEGSWAAAMPKADGPAVLAVNAPE
jgi:hypothetical protein